uniref:Beta-lactamase domain protein n=1 Tax=mine drainage metagenome TaxID=410659 RepID=E6Q4V9_9ZZZZ
MIVESFPVGALSCNATILGDERTGEAIVIDGGDGREEVLQRLAARGLRARYLVHTHAHFDHIADVGGLRERTGALALLHPADLPIYHAQPALVRAFGFSMSEPVQLDGDILDGDRLVVGSLALEVLHTPGHTPGSVSFSLANGSDTTIFSGDTLFAGSIGRWDVGGTSMEDIVDSIERKLLVFDDRTLVVPGHGPSTTIGHERRTNPYLAQS